MTGLRKLSSRSFARPRGSGGEEDGAATDRPYRGDGGEDGNASSEEWSVMPESARQHTAHRDGWFYHIIPSTVLANAEVERRLVARLMFRDAL